MFCNVQEVNVGQRTRNKWVILKSTVPSTIFHWNQRKINQMCMRPTWGTVLSTKYCHNLKPEWTAATPKVRFSKSTNLKQSNIVLYLQSYWAPESSIFDHLSKFLLRWKLPYALHQVLIGVPVPSEHLKCCWYVFWWAKVSRISEKRRRDTLPIGGMIWKE